MAKSYKRQKSALDYSLQVKVVRHYLVIASPEWKIQISAGTLAHQSIEGDAVSVHSIGKAVLQIFSEIQKRIDEYNTQGKSVPDKQIRHSDDDSDLYAEQNLTISQVATLLGVSQGTIRRLTEKGYLKSTLTPGGHRRYSQIEIQIFMNERFRFQGKIPGYRSFEK